LEYSTKDVWTSVMVLLWYFLEFKSPRSPFTS